MKPKLIGPRSVKHETLRAFVAGACGALKTEEGLSPRGVERARSFLIKFERLPRVSHLLVINNDAQRIPVLPHIICEIVLVDLSTNGGFESLVP